MTSKKVDFPRIAAAPREPLDKPGAVGPGLDEEAHQRRRAVGVRIHGVEDRRVAAEPVQVDAGRGVDIGAELDERAGGVEMAELGRDVEQRGLEQRGERRLQRGSMRDEGRVGGDGRADFLRIVEHDGRNERVTKRGPATHDQAEAFGEVRRNACTARAANLSRACHRSAGWDRPRRRGPRGRHRRRGRQRHRGDRRCWRTCWRLTLEF